jgi:nucleoside-diphosphate-sugar epimerase
MRNILITGATGFVGQNLSVYLDLNDCEVTQLSLREKNWKTSIPENTTAIIHLAGKAHDTKNTSEASEYFEINTELTKEIFDIFLKSSIRDFFYFSSVKAAADSVEKILFENIEPKPTTPYGQSKIQAEHYILSKTIPINKRVFIIRPCMIHGVGNKGNLNLLFNVVRKGIPYPLASYENERSFLSIDNLNFLILKILKTESINSGIYNFADDDFISTNKLVIIISDVLQKKGRLLKVPKSLIATIAKFGDVLHLPLNSEKLMKLTENYRVSNQKIKDALHIKNLPVSAKEGLEKTIKSFIK